MEIAAFSINSFSGIPLCTKIFENIFADINVSKKIQVHHCEVKGFVNYSEKVIVKPLRFFESYNLFKTQSSFFKISKYFKVSFRLFVFLFLKRRPVVYTIDANTCTISLLFKGLLFYKKIHVVYHQFEMDIPQDKTRIDKLIFKIFTRVSPTLDLFLVPEKNRLSYFKKLTKLKDENCIVFPNSTEVSEVEKEKNNKIVFGHVGAIGNTHYIESFLKAFTKLNREKELLLIGRVSDDMLEMISKYALTNVRMINQVPHNELGKYYSMMDFGLILYMPVDLNNIYCAPNKLYEFWSYGIPVIAPLLEGLKDIYSMPFLGKLINMENEDSFANELEACIDNKVNYSKNDILEYFESHLSIKKHAEILKTKLQEFN